MKNLYFKRRREWIKLIKSVAYSSQGSQTGQLDSCNWHIWVHTLIMIKMVFTIFSYHFTVNQLTDWMNREVYIKNNAWTVLINNKTNIAIMQIYVIQKILLALIYSSKSSWFGFLDHGSTGRSGMHFAALNVNSLYIWRY